MKKAITSKYTESVTVIERADWSISFYDVETGRHYTRRVWYPVHGSDIYVQHRGGFYSIMTEFKGKYDPQAISRCETVSADELKSMTAEIIARRAGKQHADALTWEESTRVYAYAVICNDADTEATMTAIVDGILQNRDEQPEPAANATAEDIAAEAKKMRDVDVYADSARAFADTAEYAEAHDDPEAARKCAEAAREMADNAVASYEYSRHTCYADYQTSAYAAQALEIRSEFVEDAKQAADRAEAAAERAEQATKPEPEPAKPYAVKIADYAVAQLLDAYIKATGTTWAEYVNSHDDEQAQALYRVAAVEIIPADERPAGYEAASPEDYATVSAVVAAIAADPEDLAAVATSADHAEAYARKAANAAKNATAYDARTFAEYAAACADDARRTARYNRNHYGTDDRANVARAEAAADRADRAATAAEHYEAICKADDAAVSFCAAYTEATGEIPYADDAAAVCRVARHDIAHQIISTRADREIVADMVEDIARSTSSREPYQRHELEAYLGEPDDYDVDAIEAEATAYDPKTGAQVWRADIDLAAICERHELYSYAIA